MSDESRFRVHVTFAHENALVLILEGDVDVSASSAFKGVLEWALRQDVRQVIVDLSRSSFLGATALGVLVSGARRADGRTLTVVCGDGAIRRMMDVARLGICLRVCGSLESALAAGERDAADPSRRVGGAETST